MDPDGERLRPGFSVEQMQKVVDAGGRLPRHDILRCRVRYLSDGLVLGSREFVESTFARYRDQFGLKRKTGARAMKCGDWDGLSTMRDLRKAAILVPVTPSPTDSGSEQDNHPLQGTGLSANCPEPPSANVTRLNPRFLRQRSCPTASQSL